MQKLAWALDIKTKSPLDKFVLLILADHCPKGGYAFPKIETICEETGLSRRAVSRSLASLQAQGLITDTLKKAGRTKQVSVYVLNDGTKSIEPYSSLFEKETAPNSPEGVGPEGTPSTPPNIVLTRTPNTGGDLSKKKEREERFKAEVGSWFRRRPDTAWSVKEMKSLREVLANPVSLKEVELLKRYYTSKHIPSEKDYRRRDILTLLNNWNGEIDRARKWAAPSNEMWKPSF